MGGTVAPDIPIDTTGYVTAAEIRRRYGWGTARLFRLVTQRQIRRLELPGRLLYCDADVAAIDSRQS